MTAEKYYGIIPNEHKYVLVLSFGLEADTLNSKEIAKNVIESKGGIAKVADMVSAGLSRQSIKTLYANSYIERVCQGYYKLNSNLELTDEQILLSVVPEFVMCMESALFYYGYSDFMPRVKSIAVPRTASHRIADISPIPLKIYYVANDIYSIGKTTVTENGVQFAVYDRERTICDVFKHRNKIDSEIFNKAVNAYAKDDKKNLSNLTLYSKELRVYKKVTEIMGVLLNG